MCAEVPQPRDWLAVWRSIRSPASFNAAAANHATASFLRRSNNRTKDVSPEAFKSMIGIMARCEKTRIRNYLKQAECISICMDDRGEFRSIHARCAYMDGEQIVSKLVILGIARAECKELEDMDKDYGQKVLEGTLHAIRKICTDSKNSVDEEQVASVRKKIMVLVADGAPSMQKALKVHYWSDKFPSLALLVRDACHAIRIALKDPLCPLSVLR